MKKYPAYKSIKGTFYEQLPCDWNQLYLKQVCSEKCIKNTDNKETNVLSLSYGRIIKKKNINSGLSPKDFATYQIIKPNDIILRLTDLQNDHKSLRTGISEQTGIITSAYTCLTEIKNSRFLHYVLHSMDLNKVFYRLGSGVRQSLSYGDIRYLPVPAPSMQEQQQIVRYLDWKISQINHLIHGYERLISLLEERKTAVINEAVTKGVRKGVTMKDSGVEWLGYIPEHWPTMRCKMLFTELDLRSLDGSETHLSMSQKYGLIPEEKLKERHTVSESYAGAKICYKNDLVLNRLKAHLGVFALAPQLGVVSPDYTVLRVKEEKILPKFAEMVLKSDACRRELRIRVRGITEGFWRLYTDDFNTIVLPVPSLNEQKEILDSLVEKNARLDKARTSLQKEIELLRERRTRLISDVVTGALDVRDVVVPEYVQEQDMEVTEDGDEYEGERAGETDC